MDTVGKEQAIRVHALSHQWRHNPPLHTCDLRFGRYHSCGFFEWGRAMKKIAVSPSIYKAFTDHCRFALAF
jgi:hypothetical protein